MNEIKCPKCNEVFKVDESGFADIISTLYTIHSIKNDDSR